MLVKPDFTTQPPTTNENAPKINELPLQAKEIISNNGENTVVTAPSSTIIPNTDTEELNIRKKRQYKAFMKLIKEKKYTTAVLTARHLGVNRVTIQSWLETKSVRILLDSTYDKYISDIAVSKDWKAKAYLLDKLEDKDNTKDTNITLNSLIQVNTVAPSTPKQGTITI